MPDAMSAEESRPARSRPRSSVSLQLSVAIAVWSLFSLGAALEAAHNYSGTGSGKAGAFLGRLLAPLLLVMLVRAVWRLIRRRPIGAPVWTPALFYAAAVISVLSTLSTLHH